MPWCPLVRMRTCCACLEQRLWRACSWFLEVAQLKQPDIARAAAGTLLRIGGCRVRRAPRTAGGLPPRLLPAAEMALVCGSVGAALALLQPLPLCPLRQARPPHRMRSLCCNRSTESPLSDVAAGMHVWNPPADVA
jgi:hypothetical protein